MKIFSRFIQGHQAQGLMNDAVLSREARWLLYVQGLFNLGNGLAGLFVNIYLWKLHPQMRIIALYNLFVFSTVLLAFPVWGWLAKKKNSILCLILGMMFYSIFYLAILALKEKVINYLFVFGMLMGAAISSTALAYHVLTYDTTDNKNRDLFYGLNGLIGSLIGMAAPLFSGWVIVAFKEMMGYRVIFLISTSLLVFSGVASLVLAMPAPRQDYRFFKVLATKNRDWRRIMAAMGILGLRDGIFVFIVNLLVFINTRSELSLGGYSFLTSTLGLLSFYIVGKNLQPEKRIVYSFVGAIMLALATFVLAFSRTIQGILVFGVINAVFNPLWSIPSSSLSFQAIGNDPDSSVLRLEYIVVREIPLNLGRISSLAIFLVLEERMGSEELIRGILLVLGLVFLAAWFQLKGVGKE
ncbi:MAG: MFS transporter [Firmicutes bacterium]|nr:MFS transporter [Bacillota bacterium]